MHGTARQNLVARNKSDFRGLLGLDLDREREEDFLPTRGIQKRSCNFLPSGRWGLTDCCRKQRELAESEGVLVVSGLKELLYLMKEDETVYAKLVLCPCHLHVVL